MPKISSMLLVGVLVLLLVSGCGRFRKIDPEEVAIQFISYTNQGSQKADNSRRGLRSLSIDRNDISITRDSDTVCTGKIDKHLLKMLVQQLNNSGFMFTDQPTIEDKDIKTFSIKVTEFDDGEEIRQNELTYTKNHEPGAATLLALSRIHNNIRDRGYCKGVLQVGDPCHVSQQCHSKCCRRFDRQFKVCRMAKECKMPPLVEVVHEK